MAQELTEIFTGMPRGPEAIQDNFSKLGKAGAVYHGWDDTGIIMLNGAQKAENSVTSVGYQYIQFDGFKLVEVMIRAKNITKSSIDIAKIPSFIAHKGATMHYTGISGNFGTYRTSLDGDTISFPQAESISSASTSTIWVFNATYLREDD